MWSESLHYRSWCEVNLCALVPDAEFMGGIWISPCDCVTQNVSKICIPKWVCVRIHDVEWILATSFMAWKELCTIILDAEWICAPGFHSTNIRKSPRICSKKLLRNQGPRWRCSMKNPRPKIYMLLSLRRKPRNYLDVRSSNFYIYTNSCGLDKNLHLILIFSSFFALFRGQSFRDRILGFWWCSKDTEKIKAQRVGLK
jgi:hypothetical protein